MDCKLCGNEIKLNYLLSKKQAEKRLYCGMKCKEKAQIGTKCSEETKQKMHNSASKTRLKDWINLNGAWNKGKHKDKISLGKYYGIPMKDHPQANCLGYVLEHRLKMEEKLGRLLEKGEVVHHINRNEKDNRIENLELMTRSKHNSIHRKGGDLNG